MRIKKLLLGIFLLLVVGVAVVLITLQMNAKKTVVDFLAAKIPSHIGLVYGDLSVNVMQGSMEIKDITVSLCDSASQRMHTRITAKSLLLQDFNYWQFYRHNTISATRVGVAEPVYRFYPDQITKEKPDSIPKGVVKLLKTIKVKEIAISNGQFLLMNATEDTTFVAAHQVNFILKEGLTNPEIIREKIPFHYKSYSFNSSDIFVDLGPYERLSIGALNIIDKNIKIKSTVLQSKYDREQLSTQVNTEHDHILLSVPEVDIKNLDFGFHGQRFFVATDSMTFQAPDLKMYRDKLLPDNWTKKKLYTQLLREMPIDFETKGVRINKGSVRYEEKLDPGTVPGEIFLDDISVSIQGLTNVLESSEGKGITVNATANLMGSSLLELEWKLNVFDPDDTFLVSGSLDNFRCDKADLFLRPMLGVEAEGIIDKMYFTFNGNGTKSTGDLKMNYRDFKFKVMAKDGDRVNKFLTALGNLFVSDGSKADDEGFRHGKIAVDRNMNKSFFNYIWINIRSGIISVLTGNGKKE